MKTELAHSPESTASSGEWNRSHEGVVGNEKHIGLTQIAEGYRIDPHGKRQSGALLAIDWLIRDEFFCATLFKCDDGRSVFVRNATEPVLGRAPKTLFDCLDPAPYSSRDPLLDADALAIAFARPCLGRLKEAAAEIRPLVERFLAAYYDSTVLDVQVGRAITAHEYAFLQVNLARRQAVEAMPWLLPYIALHHGTRHVTEILRTIDGKEELVPALGQHFGVGPSVIRAMAVFPAWSPNAFKLGEPMGVDAPDIARALAHIAPEQRPDKDRVRRLIEVIAWVRAVLRQAGGQASRSLVAYATAEVWKRLRRRPYALPKLSEISWLADMAMAVKNWPGMNPKPAEGIVGGEMKSFRYPVWATAYCLGRYHPLDLAAMGRAWGRRETEAIREAVRKHLPVDFAFASPFTDQCVTTCGWTLQRLRTAGDLVLHSDLAANCLATWLPSLLRGQYVVYALRSPTGEIEGHAAYGPDEAGGVKIAQVFRFRNRKPTAVMMAAVQDAQSRFVADLEGSFPFPPALRRALVRKIAQADAVIETARAAVHRETVAGIFGKTVECFQIQEMHGAKPWRQSVRKQLEAR